MQPQYSNIRSRILYFYVVYGLNVAHQLSYYSQKAAAEAVDDLAASQWMQTVSYIHTLALLPLKRVGLKLTHKIAHSVSPTIFF